MLSNDNLLIICITLIVILILVGVYGVIAYKIYLKQNTDSLSDIIHEYNQSVKQTQDTQTETLRTMVDLIKHIEFFKAKNGIE